MLRLLIVVAILLVVGYVVSSQSIGALKGITQGDPERGVKPKLRYSQFKITFRDQYFCYSNEDLDWVMRGHRTDEECRGPFIDSTTLCNEMALEGVDSVRLYWEGRVLECE